MTSTALLTRRRLLHHSALGTGAAAALAVFPRPLTAMFGGARPEPIPSVQDDRIKVLVQRALDAATAAGATYADVRMTHTRTAAFSQGHGNPVYHDEVLHVGVRALVNGYWGFATSPLWSPEELTRLGTAATRQAKENALGKPRDIVLPPVTVVRNGHWETPVQLDPFVLHPDEIGDYLSAMDEKIRVMVSKFDRLGRDQGAMIVVGYTVVLQSKAFGSTDGSYCTQRLMRSEGQASVNNSAMSFQTGILKGSAHDLLTPTAAGWEMFRHQPVMETLHQNILYNEEMRKLPERPVEVGRYTTVLDARSVANLLSKTIGVATQLDRSLGYEANAAGTSYLMDPDTMIGTYKLGTPALTVTANRNEPGGTATTAWDDEGIVPATFTLIDRGVVTEFLTSREGAGWLKSRSDQLKRRFRSLGCMYSQVATDVPTIHTPNLVIQPDAAGGTLQDLEATVEHGVSLSGLDPQMDFQVSSGYGNELTCYEIRNGKRVARIRGAGALFRTVELWQGVGTIGGMKSAQRFGLTAAKGQPVVEGHHSVTAVPLTIKDFTLIEETRR